MYMYLNPYQLNSHNQPHLNILVLVLSLARGIGELDLINHHVISNHHHHPLMNHHNQSQPQLVNVLAHHHRAYQLLHKPLHHHPHISHNNHHNYTLLPHLQLHQHPLAHNVPEMPHKPTTSEHSNNPTYSNKQHSHVCVVVHTNMKVLLTHALLAIKYHHDSRSVPNITTPALSLIHHSDRHHISSMVITTGSIIISLTYLTTLYTHSPSLITYLNLHPCWHTAKERRNVTKHIARVSISSLK